MEKYDKGKICVCRPCRCTKFVPCTTPRYNKNGVQKSVWMSDLRVYNEHRKRCFNAQSKIDTKPPSLDMTKKMQPTLLLKDARRLAQLDKENKQFMMRLTTIERLGGLIDSVNSQVNFHMSNWQGQKSYMLQIERENQKMHKRMTQITSRYKYSPKEWKRFLDSLEKAANYPLVVFKKKNLDKEIEAQPSISIGFPKISSHMECFLDFTLQNGEYLGRIILKLYQDIAPVQCQYFMDFCNSYSEQTTKNIIVQRIVKDRYLESSFITNIKAEKQRTRNTKPAGGSYKLKHSRTGVISMIRDEKRMNNLKLCLTFCSIPQLDRKNTVFGKVTKGIDVLMKINGYGRKIGKPLETIILSDCRELPECICHKKMFKCKPY